MKYKKWFVKQMKDRFFHQKKLKSSIYYKPTPGIIKKI